MERTGSIAGMICCEHFFTNTIDVPMFTGNMWSESTQRADGFEDEESGMVEFPR